MKEKKDNKIVIILCIVILVLACVIGFLVKEVVGKDNSDNKETKETNKKKDSDDDYISSSKKSTYIEIMQTYTKAARNEALMGEYMLPVNNKEVTVISFKKLSSAIEEENMNSPFGKFVDEYSYVMIFNDGTAEEPYFIYYVAAKDSKGYGIGDESTAKAIAYDSLKNKNIVKLSKGIKASDAASDIGAKIVYEYN